MTRVKRGYITKKCRKKILTFVASSRGAHSKLFRATNQQKMRALVSAHQRELSGREIFIVCGLLGLMQRPVLIDSPIINLYNFYTKGNCLQIIEYLHK